MRRRCRVKVQLITQKVMSRWGWRFICTLLVLWSGWSLLTKESHGAASIVVHSVVDRPINFIYVNGYAGNNATAFDGFSVGGGGRAGPYRIEGNTVDIDWLLSVTMVQQEELDYRAEPHSVSLPMPEREEGENEFCVLFLPKSKPVVRWAKNCVIEMDDIVDRYRAVLTREAEWGDDLQGKVT